MLPKRVRARWPGLIACVALAAGSWGLASVIPRLGTASAALVVGIVLGHWLRRSPTGAGVKWTGKQVLAWALVALGPATDLSGLLDAGWGLALGLTGSLCAALGAVWVAGRWLGLGAGLTPLLAVGNAICGTTAIAAAATVVDHDEADVGVAVGVVNLVGTVGLFTVPAACLAVGLDAVDAGIVTGASLQAVGHVVAAGFSLGDDAGAVATAAKMFRVAMLVPVVFVLARTQGRSGGGARVPPELLGFVVGTALASFGVLPTDVVLTFDLVAKALLAVAMVGIGARIDLGTLKASAPRAIAVVGGVFVVHVAALIAWRMLA